MTEWTDIIAWAGPAGIGSIFGLGMSWGILRTQIQSVIKDAQNIKADTNIKLAQLRQEVKENMEAFTRNCREFRSDCKINLAEDNQRLETKLDRLDEALKEQTILITNVMQSFRQEFNNKLDAFEPIIREVIRETSILKGKTNGR